EGPQNCVTGPTTRAIPTDSSLPAGVQILNQLFTVYNGVITNVSAYSVQNGSTDVKQLTLSGTTSAIGKNVLILFGAHLARDQDWGAGNGAQNFPGGSGKINVTSFSGGGNDDAVGINPGSVLSQSLSITSTNVTEGNSGTKNVVLTVTLSPASTESVT